MSIHRYRGQQCQYHQENTLYLENVHTAPLGYHFTALLRLVNAEMQIRADFYDIF